MPTLVTSPAVHVIAERCAGCQECVIRCPTEALSMEADLWIAQANDAKCVGCRQCVRTCPFNAIEVAGPLLVADSIPLSATHPSHLLGNTAEIHHGFPSLASAIAEAERCLNCPDPTCIIGCPAHNDIPAFIAAIRAGDMRKASTVLSATSCLPDECSRICDWGSQCEGACSWTLAGGKAVAIGLLERFVADQAPAQPPRPSTDTGRNLSVAIVGSGPAGIAAAWELAQAGAKVTMYERAGEPGGVPRWGIPLHMLPDNVVTRPLSALAEAGVTMRCNTALGKDVSLSDLLSDSHAVILCLGASVPLRPRLPGHDLAGTEDATTFLSRAKRALSRGEKLADVEGANILVLGAGNTAMDVARSIIRLGGQPLAIDWMEEHFARVRPDEIAEARAEGVDVRFAVTVEALEGADGRVKTAVLRHTRQQNASTQPKLTNKPLDRVPVDKVIFAMGYRVEALEGNGPSLPVTVKPADLPDRRWIASGIFASTTSSVGMQAWRREALLTTARAARQGMAGRVWAAGDALSGPSTVAGSMAQGRDAARSVLRAYQDGQFATVHPSLAHA